MRDAAVFGELKSDAESRWGVRIGEVGLYLRSVRTGYRALLGAMPEDGRGGYAVSLTRDGLTLSVDVERVMDGSSWRDLVLDIVRPDMSPYQAVIDTIPRTDPVLSVEDAEAALMAGEAIGRMESALMSLMGLSHVDGLDQAAIERAVASVSNAIDRLRRQVRGAE